MPHRPNSENAVHIHDYFTGCKLCQMATHGTNDPRLLDWLHWCGVCVRVWTLYEYRRTRAGACTVEGSSISLLPPGLGTLSAVVGVCAYAAAFMLYVMLRVVFFCAVSVSYQLPWVHALLTKNYAHRIFSARSRIFS